MTEPSGATRQDAVKRTKVLILTRDDVVRRLLEHRMAESIEANLVVVADLSEPTADAAVEADEAITAADPSLVLFTGWGVTPDRGAVGDVVIADRVSRLGGRAAPRAMTRRADPGVLRYAGQLVSDRASGPGLPAQRTPADVLRIRMGSVVAGTQALALWENSSGSDFWQRFPGAVGLDVTGWDFLFGYYDLVELPALAILGLARENELHSLVARERAVEATAELLRVIPPDGLPAQGVAAAADDGELHHLLGDVTSLSHESPQGILQRPFVDSARATHVRRRANGPSGTSKDRIESAVFHAYVDEENVAPADLTLTVRLTGERLEFELHGTKHFQRSVGAVDLGGAFKGDPHKYRESIMQKIRRIAAEGQTAELADLQNLGNQLYWDLFPAELKRAYREFRGNEQIQTLLVVTDDPWIPWELIKPYDPDEPGFDDDFLCARFAMTRWRRGNPPKPRFRINSVASLEASSVDGMDVLETAKAECDYLRDLAASRRVVTLGRGGGEYANVQSLLAEDVHLWHVAAHGCLGESDPEESAIMFADRPWTSGDLIATASIRRVRPLVFLNACLVGQQDFRLAELGGWPEAWIVKNNCGALIAPQWWVTSELASAFAKAFYTAVVGDEAGQTGKTLADAARAARLEVRQERPADPTWLSYVVYGHPNARVHFQAPSAGPP